MDKLIVARLYSPSPKSFDKAIYVAVPLQKSLICEIEAAKVLLEKMKYAEIKMVLPKSYWAGPNIEHQIEVLKPKPLLEEFIKTENHKMTIFISYLVIKNDSSISIECDIMTTEGQEKYIGLPILDSTFLENEFIHS